jgi:hypothetical protein
MMKHFIQGLIVGNTINLTIDGKLYKKSCPNEASADAFFNAIVEAKANPTDDAVEILLTHLNQSMRVAKENGLDYDMETGEIYLKGFNTPIPELLVKTIEKNHEKGRSIDNVVNFWKLLMINPDKRVRTSLFDFIAKHDFSITDNGYMVVYKAVEYFDQNNSNDLNTFVTNAAFHVRKDWKCSPSKYAVYQDEDGTYHITKETTLSNWDVTEKNVTYIGNLAKLEKASADLSAKDDAVKFIPKHVTYNMSSFNIAKETIRLGVPQKMERKECDSDPVNECSYGLHVGATSYVRSFASRGSAILTCFVNPAHVIAVPNYDRSKMRVCEYFPYALNERDENGNFTVVDQPYFEHDYLAYEKEELDRQIKAINDKETRVGVDTRQAEDDRKIEEVLKALKSRVVDLEQV